MLRSLVPSILALAGVFFFINAACYSVRPDEPLPKPCTVRPETPQGARIEFVQPQDGATFVRQRNEPFMRVTVQLRATGVTTVPFGQCKSGGGHYDLRVRSETAKPDCCMSDTEQHRTTGAKTLELGPGAYELTAHFVDGYGDPYQPPLLARVHIVVDPSTPGAAGSETARDAGALRPESP